MKILVTGFEPFGNDTYNPSMEVLGILPKRIKDAEIVTGVLPVVRFASLRKMEELIEKEHPDAILSLGMAGGRSAITPERTAVNGDDYRIADNGGLQPCDEPVYADGPDAYFSLLPIKAMVRAIRACELPAEVSESAGTFVCNHVFYGTRYYCAIHHPDIRCGFMHVPYASEQCAETKPSLALDDIARGVKAAIEAIITELS